MGDEIWGGGCRQALSGAFGSCIAELRSQNRKATGWSRRGLHARNWAVWQWRGASLSRTSSGGNLL